MDVFKVDTGEKSLRQLQGEFTWKIARLIGFAYRHGYYMTFGAAQRCAACPIGHPNSLHKSRLAVDFNLFRVDDPGVLLVDTEDHRQLGEYWEAIGGTWGGRFGDGNHYSMTYRGMK